MRLADPAQAGAGAAKRKANNNVDANLDKGEAAMDLKAKVISWIFRMLSEAIQARTESDLGAGGKRSVIVPDLQAVMTQPSSGSRLAGNP